MKANIFSQLTVSPLSKWVRINAEEWEGKEEMITIIVEAQT